RFSRDWRSDVCSSDLDEKKLRAFNGEYIRALDATEFIERCAPWLGSESAPWPAENFDAQAFEAVAPLAQSRVSVLSEIVEYVDLDRKSGVEGKGGGKG